MPDRNPVSASYRFKTATEPWEFEALARLNHATFAGEIPQHEPRPDGRLVDRFHEENHYLIALDGQDLVGMVALRDRRPFSLDQKLPDLDRHLPPHRSLCEVRLLAVRPEHRHTRVFRGLLEATVRTCRRRGHDLAVISGTVRQLKLYAHLGFEPFGPRVGTPEAEYQPMFLRAEAFAARHRDLWEPLNFLPGPVPLEPSVRRALAGPARYHRDAPFQAAFASVRRRLCDLTGAPRVQVLVGSGTLANEAVAAQLSLRPGPGLVLSNGEFGDRLLEQARRWGLEHRIHRIPWGQAFDPASVARALEGAAWLWAVHGETSTGVLNDLGTLKGLTRQADAALALDCVSTLGAVPLDLAGVAFAAATSGKALGAFPGLALVLHAEPAAPSERLPRYLDLGVWEASGGVPFTHSSNLIAALEKALDRFDGEGPFDRLATQSRRLREACVALGLPVLAAPEHAHPAALTFPLPPERSAEAFGETLLARGFQLAWHSTYLRERNWIQACLMVPPSDEDLEALIEGLRAAWSG